MNNRRLPAFLFLMSCVVAAPIAAQRGDRPTQQPRPSSTGSQSPRPAPTPRPSATPVAPRPSVQAPRPVMQNPVAPAPRPTVQEPAPVIRQPTPAARQPGITYPSPRTTPTPSPVVRQPGVDSPPPIVRTPRTTPSPIDTNRPGVDRVTRPAPVIRTPDAGRTTLPPRVPGARDSIYRTPTPSPATGNDTDYRPSPGSVRSPSIVSPRPTESRTTNPGAIRPRPAESRVSRYAPNDTLPSTTRPAVTARPRTRAAAVTTTPTLVPRSTAPRLTVPRSSVAGVTAIGGTVVPRVASPISAVHGSRGYVAYDSSCHRTWWRSWWDPCRYDSRWSWNWYGGCGPYTWHISLWEPWCWLRYRYWNDCYFDTWWYGCGHAGRYSTTYWWYPSSVYCPSYLSVPSSTVVYVERDPEPAPPAAPREVIVAGGNVDGSARADDAGDDLAKKYVELGDFYFEAARFTDAADAYARAKSYAPNNASVIFAMADAAFANGDYHFAAYLIADAVRLQPSIVSAEIDRRVYYGDPQLFEDQMAQLDKYLAAKPYDAQAHLVRAYNLRFSGKPVAAVAAFRRVLEIAPESRAAQAFLAALAPPDSEPTIR